MSKWISFLCLRLIQKQNSFPSVFEDWLCISVWKMQSWWMWYRQYSEHSEMYSQPYQFWWQSAAFRCNYCCDLLSGEWLDCHTGSQGSMDLQASQINGYSGLNLMQSLQCPDGSSLLQMESKRCTGISTLGLRSKKKRRVDTKGQKEVKKIVTRISLVNLRVVRLQSINL